MNLRRCLGQSLTAVAGNRLRTGLSVMVLATGVATLVVMVALADGAGRAMTAEIDSMGSNLLTVRAAQERKLTQRRRQFSQVTTLRPEDADAIAGLTEVSAVAPACIRSLRVKYGELSTTTKVVGTTSDFLSVRSFSLQHGRFFTDAEVRAGLRVGVIGSDLQAKLFGDRDPIGERLRIGRVPVEIIGTLIPKGLSRDGANEDDLLVLPVRTALRRILNLRHLDVVYVQALDRGSLDQAELTIRELLRRRHRLERAQRLHDQQPGGPARNRGGNPPVVPGADRLDCRYCPAAGRLRHLAIMLLTVRERTNEIGLRLALGARRRDIQVQFLAEALGLASAGGLTGMLLAAAACLIARTQLSMAVELGLQTAGLAVLFSVTIGLVFGVRPARQAIPGRSPAPILTRQSRKE
jgi:putative ABC transport system permease protein